MVAGAPGNLGQNAVNPVELDPDPGQDPATTQHLYMEASSAQVQTRIHLHVICIAVVSFLQHMKLHFQVLFCTSC